MNIEKHKWKYHVKNISSSKIGWKINFIESIKKLPAVSFFRLTLRLFPDLPLALSLHQKH
jgi:hypothetical protein